jgi:mRNA interferase MazF
MITMTQQRLDLKRGDVVLVAFPNSNLTTAKTRPALVVQADNLQTGLSQIIVAMITSKMFRAGHPSRVTILLRSPEGQQTGLLTDSVVMTDNLATITLSAVHRMIGSFSTTDVDQALRHTLNLMND